MINDSKSYIGVIWVVVLIIILSSVAIIYNLHQAKRNNNIQELLLEGFKVECANYAHSTTSSN